VFFERPETGEVAILVHVGADPAHEEADLREFEELALSAGASPAALITASSRLATPRFLVGTGKVEEIAAAIALHGAALVLFNNTLSPSQERNLEKELKCRVLDRTGLILDIFAQRARSHEGKLQVELAQLKHASTRLVRGWTHLDRQKGGIGLRGAGETQLEIDQRLISVRMGQVRKSLEKVRSQRGQGRRARQRAEIPTVSLVGYTNAGKSSVLRAMAEDREVFVEDRLFATLDPLTREVEVGEGYAVLLTDTVGFIRKLPHHLVASFRATLAEAREADLLLHVIDASHPAWEEHRDIVDGVLRDLGLEARPRCYVLNKMDALPAEVADAVRARVAALLPGSLFVSAVVPGGLEPLRARLLQQMRTQRPLLEVRMPASDGRLLAELHRDGEVVAQRHDEASLILEVRCDERTIGRLRRAGAGIRVLQGTLPPEPGMQPRPAIVI
jgi:GTP-binding protein HflX